MDRLRLLLVTAIAPLFWGSTYIVTTEGLAGWHPVLVATLRAVIPAVLLLALIRQWPAPALWPRLLILGALNFAIFWVALFVATYRLPGGVAATVGAIQPLIVLVLARVMLGTALSALAILAGILGVAGVALLVLGPQARLDMAGIVAGLLGAASMAAGTVLTRHWQAGTSPLVMTTWQLVAGALLLLPALAFLPLPATVNRTNIAAVLWLSLAGAALTYALWFRGIRRLGPNAVAALALLSPAMAVLLGWALKGEVLTAMQIIGLVMVVASILMAQQAAAKAAAKPA